MSTQIMAELAGERVTPESVYILHDIDQDRRTELETIKVSDLVPGLNFSNPGSLEYDREFDALVDVLNDRVAEIAAERGAVVTDQDSSDAFYWTLEDQADQ